MFFGSKSKQSVNMFDQLETIIYQKSSLASLGLLIYNIVNGQTVDNLLLSLMSLLGVRH